MGEFAGQLGDTSTDRLDAEDPVIVFLRDDPDKPAIAAGFERQRAAAGRERKLRGDDLRARRGRRLVRRQPGADDLGFGEADRRDRVGIEMAALAGDDLGHHRALRCGLVRQHRLADQIADRPDIAHRGTALVVDLDERSGHVEAHFLEAPARRQRPPSDRDQNLVGLDRDLFSGRGLDRELAGIIEAGNARAEMQLDPVALQPAPHRPGQRLVVARQDSVGGLDHRHRRAKLAERDAEFEPDIAGADHRQPLRQLR